MALTSNAPEDWDEIGFRRLIQRSIDCHEKEVKASSLGFVPDLSDLRYTMITLQEYSSCEMKVELRTDIQELGAVRCFLLSRRRGEFFNTETCRRVTGVFNRPNSLFF